MTLPISDNVAWIIVGAISIVCVTMAIFLFYHWLQFRKRCKEQIIQKRFPGLVTFINWSVMTYLLCRPFLIVTMSSPLIYSNFKLYKLVTRGGNITEGIIFWGSTWPILIRYWLIYYELNYNNSL
eukprot:550142_1